MTNVLPPGIWDNPQPDDQKVYDQFVKVWSLDDSAYIQHYQEWSETQDFVDVTALAYDGGICPDCPTLTGSGVPIVLSLISEENAVGSGGYSEGQDGQNNRGCGKFIFGYGCWVAADAGTDLPQGEIILTAQTDNCIIYNAWAIFENTLEEDAVITEATLKMWPAEDAESITTSGNTCVSAGTNIPEVEGCDDCPIAGYANQYTTVCGAHPRVSGEQEPIDLPRVSGFDVLPQPWLVGGVVYTRDISCVVQPQVNDQYITIAIGPYVADGLAINKRWYANNVELIIRAEDVVKGGIEVGGKSEETMFGVFDEFGSGGIQVGGISDRKPIMQYFPRIALSGIAIRPKTALDVFYIATGGVVVQRADVELHLDCNTPDATIVEDVSSYERDATMVNMDADNFVDGRIADNKYLDFEIE